MQARIIGILRLRPVWVSSVMHLYSIDIYILYVYNVYLCPGDNNQANTGLNIKENIKSVA